jgi:23S rRNA (guanine745-N1)-methyltransferase
LAKSGYVNLLLANQKNSKIPGDSEEMNQSRKLFLQKGYYEVLSQKLGEVIENSLASLQDGSILDLGCGVGYYLQNLINTFSKKDTFDFYGLDISKSAIMNASKSKTKAKLCVGSAYNLPFLDESLTLVYAVFSPISPIESFRVLQKNGFLILVGPGEHHLDGLAEHIYENVNPHKGNDVLQNTQHFTFLQTVEIKQKISIVQEDIINLLKMTPYYWQVSEQKLEKLNLLDSLQTNIHFEIKIYRKVLKSNDLT